MSVYGSKPIEQQEPDQQVLYHLRWARAEMHKATRQADTILGVTIDHIIDEMNGLESELMHRLSPRDED